MKIVSRAKINLTLDILAREESGFHVLETILQEIGLCDELVVERIDHGVEISCSDGAVPVDGRNLVHKAVSEMTMALERERGPEFFSRSDMPEKGRMGGIKVHIEKKIPVGAGLGGGSSNAAAVMKACNEMLGLGWSDEKLAKIGAKVGMDVPFFIYGGTALGTHYGEVLEPFPKSPELNVVVIYPGKACVTKEMYGLLDIEKCGLNVERSRGILADLMKGDEQIFGYVGNDFESLIGDSRWEMGSVISGMKEDLLERGAQVACLCGSGSAVFGLFLDWMAAEQCRAALESKYPLAWAGKTVSRA